MSEFVETLPFARFHQHMTACREAVPALPEVLDQPFPAAILLPALTQRTPSKVALEIVGVSKVQHFAV